MRKKFLIFIVFLVLLLPFNTIFLASASNTSYNDYVAPEISNTCSVNVSLSPFYVRYEDTQGDVDKVFTFTTSFIFTYVNNTSYLTLNYLSEENIYETDYVSLISGAETIIYPSLSITSNSEIEFYFLPTQSLNNYSNLRLQKVQVDMPYEYMNHFFYLTFYFTNGEFARYECYFILDNVNIYFVTPFSLPYSLAYNVFYDYAYQNLDLIISEQVAEKFDKTLLNNPYYNQYYIEHYTRKYNELVSAFNSVTFRKMFDSLFLVPIKTIDGIFNFEFLGYDFRLFPRALFTISIVILLIRRFL